MLTTHIYLALVGLLASGVVATPPRPLIIAKENHYNKTEQNRRLDEGRMPIWATKFNEKTTAINYYDPRNFGNPALQPLVAHCAVIPYPGPKPEADKADKEKLVKCVRERMKSDKFETTDKNTMADLDGRERNFEEYCQRRFTRTLNPDFTPLEGRGRNFTVDGLKEEEVKRMRCNDDCNQCMEGAAAKEAHTVACKAFDMVPMSDFNVADADSTRMQYCDMMFTRTE